MQTEPHPASARPYQASLTKNVLPLERSGARLTEREQGKAKKERGWPAIENLSSPPWHRCKDPAQESWERRTLELELVNPASTDRRRHQSLEESTRANTNNKIKHYNKKESGKPKGAREFDPAQTTPPQKGDSPLQQGNSRSSPQLRNSPARL
ncbi:hypothetical protein J6590_093415 [Homalodisca vitripennis]|nr:hypothetical protein J6590_093415 [Homalodisca vitripennis]